MGTQFTFIIAAVAFLIALSWFLLPEPWARTLLSLARRAAGLQSRHLVVNGLNWHYLRGGRGLPLVAIHGFGADADHWLRVAPALRRRFTVYAPDLVGFGSSDSGSGLTFDIDTQVDRLVAFLDALDIRRCVLAGNSMGGWIASRLADRYPERARALWLLAPLGVQDCERGELLRSIDLGRASPLGISSVGEFESRVFRPMFARPPHLPRPLKLHYAGHALSRAEASRWMFAQAAGSQPPLELLLQHMTVPVLVQWGSEDRAVHVSGAERLKHAVRDGEVIVQQGVGHLPMLEAPALSVSQFMSFAETRGLFAMTP
jgi:abhydrolase domain-containing protein 6